MIPLTIIIIIFLAISFGGIGFFLGYIKRSKDERKDYEELAYKYKF